jgi:iron(III) transport system substrate-binding protein
MLIAEYGLRQAELIVRGWLANLALPVLTDDAEVLQAIEDGRCGIGMVNSDQAAGLERLHPGTPVALFWPPAAAGGAYVDILGAGVSRHAADPLGAVRLLEWLASAPAQVRLARQILAYPATPEVPADHSLAAWSSLPISPVNIANAGLHLEDAVKLMQRAGYGSHY